MAERGIYNSSTAANRESVTNSVALDDTARANRALGLQEAQFDESRRRANQATDDALLGRRLEWIYNRNDQAPNLDRLQQTAATEGEGSTEAMSYPTAQGGRGGGIGGTGYGGAAGSDYWIPINYGFNKDRPPSQKKSKYEPPSFLEQLLALFKK